MTATAPTNPLGEYLFRRVAELGVEHIFGVPGDFKLALLDELSKVSGLHWLGACNELNAAYSADGYARIKGVPAALVTTYAVGELSAMNGVAGAYAEHGGMIHIVGTPSRPLQKGRVMLHHTLEPRIDQSICIGMSESIRKTHTNLTNEEMMAQEIDRAIVECVLSKLPVFIYVPMDVVGVPLGASRLETPLNVTIKNVSTQAEDCVVQRTLKLIKEASKPSILADVLTIRHSAQQLTRKLVELTHFPSYSTPLSKGVIDESSPYYNGLYNGQVSFPGCSDAVECSDLVLNIGPLLSDSNTGGFTRNIPNDNLVTLGHDYCQIHDEKFEGVHFLPVIKRIVEELEKLPRQYNVPRSQFWAKIEPPLLNDSSTGPITQSYVWQRIGRLLKPNDIVLAEAGTAQFGMPDAILPPNISYITQTFWSSIGYTVGACLGACVAAKELKKGGRVILLVGEGSLYTTVQEIGSYIRFGFTPIVFVINNNGYSIERAINGPEQEYINVSMLWDHQKMLEFLGARPETGIKSRSFACGTLEELEKVLRDKEFGRAQCIQLCEIFMDPFDYPWRLSSQIAIAKEKMKQMAS